MTEETHGGRFAPVKRLLMRFADFVYADFRTPRESDDGPCRWCREDVAPFEGVRTVYGIFCCHDHSVDYWADTFV